MGARKIIVGLVFLAIVVYGLYSILNPGTNTFSGEYISFEYPKDWNVTVHKLNATESVCELVEIKDKEGHMVSIAAFSKNVSLEDVKYNVSLNSLGVSDEGTIGDAHYTKYYSDEPRLDFYVFAKDGRTFLVTCDLLSNGVAEDIIKSLKVRK